MRTTEPAQLWPHIPDQGEAPAHTPALRRRLLPDGAADRDTRDKRVLSDHLLVEVEVVVRLLTDVLFDELGPERFVQS